MKILSVPFTVGHLFALKARFLCSPPHPPRSINIYQSMNAIVRQTLTLTLTKLRDLLDISCLIALFNWRSKSNENQVIAAFSRFNRPHQRSLHFAFGNPRKFGGKISMTLDIIALGKLPSRFLKTQKTFFPQNGKVAPLTFFFSLFFGYFLQKHILLTMLNSLPSY